MSWSKVITKHKLPIGWWYHKILCEFCFYVPCLIKWHFFHLKKMCDKYGYNLYGQIHPKDKKFYASKRRLKKPFKECLKTAYHLIIIFGYMYYFYSTQTRISLLKKQNIELVKALNQNTIDHNQITDSYDQITNEIIEVLSQYKKTLKCH